MNKKLLISLVVLGVYMLGSAFVLLHGAVITPWGAGSLSPWMWIPREEVVFQEMEILQGELHTPVWYYIVPDWAIGHFDSDNREEYETVVYREFYVPTKGDIRITVLYNECVQRWIASGKVVPGGYARNNGFLEEPITAQIGAYGILHFMQEGICAEYLNELAGYLLGYVPAEETQWTMVHRYGMRLSTGTGEYALVSFREVPKGVTPMSLKPLQTLLPFETLAYEGVTTIEGETYHVLKHNGYPTSIEGPYIGIVRMPTGVMDYNMFPIRPEDADVPVEVIAVYKPVPE